MLFLEEYLPLIFAFQRFFATRKEKKGRERNSEPKENHIPETFSRMKTIQHFLSKPYNPGSLNGALQGLQHVARVGSLKDCA
jgi:hypothetical protein